MHKYHFKGYSNDDLACIETVAVHLDMTLDSSGMDVTIVKMDKGLSVQKNQNGWVLGCSSLVSLARAMGFIKQYQYENTGFVHSEKPFTESLGIMIDCSRNGVPNIKALERMLVMLSVMGYDTVQLYTEDTYLIEGYPFFGYLRGAYSNDELRHLDTAASRVGIELVPCIQTLAHMKHALKWETFSKYIDCDDILLSKDERTYELIETMIKSMSKALTSRKINIGMDEAHMVGLGKYLEQHGYQDRSEIMLNHLERVLEICRKYDYEPMMWSDMFFRLLNGGEYYATDKPIDKTVLEKIPDGIKLVYWDYYSLKKSMYDDMFMRHKEMGKDIAFAGGAWKWAGFAPMNRASIDIGRLAAQSAVENGVSEILITCWGDNGGEASMFSVLPTLSFWSERCWSDRTDETWLGQRFETTCAENYEAFLLLDAPNHVGNNPFPGKIGANPSKYLLYQDAMYGIADFMETTEDDIKHFVKTQEILAKVANASNLWSELFVVQQRLCAVLELKADLGQKLREAYVKRDRQKMSALANAVIPELIKRITSFQEAYRNQWLLENKAHGMEVFDIRTGGLKERLKVVSERVNGYLSGTYTELEELETPINPLRMEKVPGSVMSCIHWEDVASPCGLTGV